MTQPHSYKEESQSENNSHTHNTYQDHLDQLLRMMDVLLHTGKISNSVLNPLLMFCSTTIVFRSRKVLDGSSYLPVHKGRWFFYFGRDRRNNGYEVKETGA